MTIEEFHDALHEDVGKPRRVERTVHSGRIAHKQVFHEPGAHKAKWARAQVNLQARSIKVQINFELKRNKLTEAEYLHLSNLVLRGIRSYWSRPIYVKRISFAVDVNAIQASTHAVEVDLSIERSRKYARSHNMAILGIDASLIYNIGYHLGNAVRADQEFMMTAAHEFGHSVLMEFGGVSHSWTHKGSTSLFQSTKADTPGYPTAGEIDLMKYYDHDKHVPPFQDLVVNTRASEKDVKCLLWMSTLSL